MMTTESVVRTSPETCVITCPRCAQSAAISTEQLRLREKPLPVRCRRCICVFKLVRVDQRRHPRKPVQLSGTLLDAATHTPLATATIIDLSLGGVRFATHLASLKVGERYRIEFILDDTLRTEIRDDIAIRIVHTDRTFGAEFLDPECHDELDLYLMPWAVTL